MYQQKRHTVAGKTTRYRFEQAINRKHLAFYLAAAPDTEAVNLCPLKQVNLA